MNINEVIGQRLKDCRKAKGLSQDELAKALDYTDRSTIAKMESGKNAVPSDIMPRLALVLGVTEAYLSAKLYATLYVLGAKIAEEPDGGVRLLDTITGRHVEYAPEEWFKLQSEDAFREVWSALTGELSEDEEKPTDQKADGLRDSGYYDLSPANRAMIDSLIESLLKSQSAE